MWRDERGTLEDKHVKKRIVTGFVYMLLLLGVMCTSAFAADSEDEMGYVAVHVTAKDRDTYKKVDVEGATVYLYVGTEVRRTAVTDNTGVALLPVTDLTDEELAVATVSATAEVSHGSASYNNQRTALYQYYPIHEEDGEYYRYKMELHSETIDAQGNWCGEALEISDANNKVDVVFVIDTTQSMSAEIERVKENLAEFAKTFDRVGMSVRFAIVEYGDITYGENTIVHGVDGSNWFASAEDAAIILDSLMLNDGGDDEETLLDALGYVADDATMKWRSDAHKLVFVLTDTGYKNDNVHGYIDMAEMVETLAAKNIKTSVITTNYYSQIYKSLYEGTGGTSANIYAEDFEDEMMELAEATIELLTKKIELVLSEPRLLLNVAVCYLVESEADQTDTYVAGVQNVLNEYANRIAEATDGHVLIDKIILYSTDDVLNFYTKGHIAAMADIRIESSAYSSTRIHSNAHIAGFFKGYAVYDSTYGSRNTYLRVQMSGVEGAGWNNSMLTKAEAYSTTLAHECGHYLFGFRDEYVNSVGEYWSTRPAGNYGLMDNNHYDIEMSKATVDYAYITSTTTFKDADESLHTKHSWTYKEACEDTLADLLTEEEVLDEYYFLMTEKNTDYYNTGDYVGTYTKAPGADRTATYDYADLDSTDFVMLDSIISGTATSTSDVVVQDVEEATSRERVVLGIMGRMGCSMLYRIKR